MKSFEFENIKNGNIELYEQLFKHYYSHLVHFSYRYAKDVQVAEDIIQDIFVNVWNKRDTLDFTLNFKSYLYSAVRNHSLMHINKTNRVELVDLKFIVEKSDNNPDVLVESNELEKGLMKIISEFPTKRREVFFLSRFDKLTYAEIAATLNISIKTVETQMSRSLKYIRKNLPFLFK